MSDLIGKTLGQHQIIELTQDTGSTLVYKGFQANMNRYVTVKVLKSQDTVKMQDFSRQTELLAQFQHPNILPVYDSGQAQGIAYRVLRFAENGVLQNHLMKYYELNTAVGLISGIVAGLEKIHAQGFVHGNLQPGNIYLDETGQPLLTDFGLPKAPTDPITPFMSPEQVQGGIVDKRTDVYALGVLLYALVTGETPPSGVVVSPRAKRPDLPESVEKVIFKAMAQNPDARFQSARELQSALSTALQPVVPVQAYASQPQTYQTAPYRRKTNWAAIILGVLLVAVLIGGAGFVFGWWGNQASEPVTGVPVEPPVEAPPTMAPGEPEVPIEPPAEAPVEPPEEPQPTPPPDGEAPIQLPAVCNSLGVAGGLVLLGIVSTFRKRVTLNPKRKHDAKK